MEMIAFTSYMSLVIGFVAGMFSRVGRRQDKIDAKLDEVKNILERVRVLSDDQTESSSASSEGEER